MKKALICGIGGTIAGIVGGGYVVASFIRYAIRVKINENGGEEKWNEFVSLMEKKREPN